MSGSVPPSLTPLQPRIHHAAAIREDLKYFTPENASRWEPDSHDRLPDADSLNRLLGEHGFIAVMYDPDDRTKPIACAATRPWTCDLEGGGVDEEGWEIMTVTSCAGWRRKGFAGRCIDVIVNELLRQNLDNVDYKQRGRQRKEWQLRVWIQVVESLNGAFWKKRGWKDIRAYEKPVGHWGSKEGFRLLVLRREFDPIPRQ